MYAITDGVMRLAKYFSQVLAGVTNAQVEQFRWMLEELRVQLFAQELRTPVPVSSKRLQKQWEGIKNG